MASSDIIKIGFDYRSSLEQFEKDTNGVFDGISNKAGKQKITIQLDAKDDKIIEKIKELQKLKLDKFTFEFGNSGLKEQLQTFDKLENKINEIINLGKGKSFIDSSSTVADIGKIVQNTNNQAKAIDKVTNSYKNQAYELASVLKMLAKLDQYGDVPYAEAFSKAVKSGAKSYKNGDDIQFAAKKYGMDEESIKYLRGLSVNLSNAFNYTDTLGLDTANITNVEKLTEYFRELLKEKLEFNNTKLNTSDIEELIKALGIAKKELFDDGTKSGRNIYGDGTLDKYSDLPQIIQYLKQQETQAIATAEAEQKLAEAQKETASNTSNSNNSQIEELKSDIQEVKTELGDVKDRISSIESNGFENVREDVEKTKESVKELNSELTEMKSNLSSTPQESNISLGDSKEQSTEIDLYHNLEKRKVTYDEIIDKIQTIVSLKEKEKSLSKTSDDTKLYQNLYDENDINWAGDTEGTINRISDRLKEIYTKYNGKISLIDENDIQEATYLLDILKGSGESPNLNKSQEKFYQNKKFSNDSLFDNIRVDSQKAEEIDKINTELSETYRWFNQLEGVSLNENIANEIKSLISDMQIGGKTASEYANDLLKIFNIEVGSNSAVEQQNKLQSELKETESQAEKTAQAVNESSSTTPEKDLKDAFPDKDVSASVESATNSIKEENNVLEQNTQKVKENTQAKEQNVNVNFNKYDKRLDSYNGKIDKYKTTIDRFNDGGWTSDTYLKNVQAVKDAVNEYETLLNELKGKDASLVTNDDINRLDNYEKKIKDTIATVTNMSASEKGYSQLAGQKEIDKINKILRENSAMSSEAKAKIKAYKQELISGNPSASLEKIHGEIMKIVNAEELAGRAGRSFFDTLKNSGFHQLAAQMAGMFGFYDVINLGKEGLSVVRELNTALTEMRKVSDESLQSLKNYQNTTFNVADAVGTTAKQIQESTADYMRLGESLDEASESAKTANVLLNVSEFDNIEDATKSLVSMGQAYKDLDKMTIVDKLNEVGNNYAISTDELATALQKSAATLSLMGNTIDEAASLVTTANATIQDADSVSAGLRTISLRLVGTEEAEKELSAMNEEVDAFVKATNSKKQQIIKDYTAVTSNNYQGFDILDRNGNYKNTYEILLGIAKVYKEIQEQDKKLGTNHATALIEELAGKNRSNIASAILQDPTQLEAVKKSSEEALGSAKKELNSYLDSIDGKMAQLENRAQEFWFKIIDSETIKNGIDLLSTLLKCATDFVDTVGLLPTILTGVTAALSFKNVGIDTLVAY